MNNFIIRNQIWIKVPLLMAFIYIRPINILAAADIAPSSENQLQSLWIKVIRPYIARDLWTDAEAYNACHFLLIPLISAYTLPKPDWQEAFADLARRATAVGPACWANGTLNRLHWLYLLSWQALLTSDSGKVSRLPAGFVRIIEAETLEIWRKPAWQWTRDPFSGGIAERISWKLIQDRTMPSYLRAFVDEDLFTPAIAGNLAAFELANPGSLIEGGAVRDVNLAGMSIWQHAVVWQADGGWLLQPGVWADHPDFAYAGRERIVQGMEPLKVLDVNWDSSHAHRWPAFLLSERRGLANNSSATAEVDRLRIGLAKQLTTKVLVPPTADFRGWRLTNFLDGRNGVFRYNYNQNLGFGYDPYELSGTWLMGWWSLLGNAEIGRSYRAEMGCLPWGIRESTVHLGAILAKSGESRDAAISREMENPRCPWVNGFAEFWIRTAAALNDRVTKDIIH